MSKQKILNTINYQEKLDELRSHLIPAESVLILTHDYPDPDCLASACGIATLLDFWGVGSCVISFGGFVGRAENRAMIRYLNINAVPFSLVEPREFSKIILVDSFPGNNNVSLPDEIKLHAVFDHHLQNAPIGASYFHDIRSSIGATSTIIFNYLRAAQVRIPPNLASALFYGIKSDTRSLGRDASPEDLEAYLSLFNQMEHALLARMENPDRDAEYFKVLHRATGSAVTYGTLGYVHIGKVSAPDSIAEMADLFLSMEKVESVVCSGIFKKNLYFSVRVKNSDNAGRNADLIAKKFGGNGGGHAMIGAGSIPFIRTGNVEQTTLNAFLSTILELYATPDAEKESIF